MTQLRSSFLLLFAGRLLRFILGFADTCALYPSFQTSDGIMIQIRPFLRLLTVPHLDRHQDTLHYKRMNRFLYVIGNES